MKQVLILVGVSGAGKSTWAINYIRENPNWVRINRDSARLMLVGDLTDYYTSGARVKDIENMVTALEGVIQASIWWGKGYNLVVDNTNLDTNRYKQYFGMPLVEVRFKFFDIHPDQAKARVLGRDKIYQQSTIDKPEDRVKYIEKQYKQYEEAKAWILKNHKDKIV